MKDTFYFPHDYNARGDEKIINLLRVQGLEGYGIYWTLIEKLYESGGRIAADFDAIAYDLRADADKVKSVATKFGLFYLTGASRLLASKSVDRRLQERRERSKLAKASADRRWDNATAMRTHTDRNADPMLERKERKERKKITAAPGAPSAADFKQVADGKMIGIEKTEGQLLEMQLPFSFGDIPRGRRVIDIDPVSAQKMLDQMPRLGAELRFALERRVRIKIEESNGKLVP